MQDIPLAHCTQGSASATGGAPGGLQSPGSHTGIKYTLTAVSNFKMYSGSNTVEVYFYLMLSPNLMLLTEVALLTRRFGDAGSSRPWFHRPACRWAGSCAPPGKAGNGRPPSARIPWATSVQGRWGNISCGPRTRKSMVNNILPC